MTTKKKNLKLRRQNWSWKKLRQCRRSKTLTNWRTETKTWCCTSTAKTLKTTRKKVYLRINLYSVSRVLISVVLKWRRFIFYLISIMNKCMLQVSSFDLWFLEFILVHLVFRYRLRPIYARVDSQYVLSVYDIQTLTFQFFAIGANSSHPSPHLHFALLLRFRARSGCFLTRL